MWSFHKITDFTKDLFVHLEQDIVSFFEGDFRSAVFFVMKEKVWCMIAALMLVVSYITYKGVQIAIAWNNDYAHDAIVAEYH